MPDRISQLPEPSHTHPLTIISWLFIFPPLGFYFIYKDPKYHSWVTNLLYITSVFPLVIFLIQALIVVPQLKVIYAETGAPADYPRLTAYYITLFLLSIGQIIYGVYLKNLLGQSLPDTKKYLLLGFVIMSFGLFLESWISGIFLNAILYPIYNLSNYMG